MKKIISIVTTYIIVSFVSSILFYIGGNYILANIKTFSDADREGFINPFSSCLGLSAFFIFIVLLIYFLLTTIFKSQSYSLLSKTLSWVIVSTIIIVLFNHKFGGLDFSFLDWGIIPEIIVISFFGGTFPSIEAFVFKLLNNK